MMRGLPWRTVFVLLAGSLLLGACAETQLATEAVKEAVRPGQNGTYKVGKPYQIQGVWYYPSANYDYDETGIASWYGPNFHGKYTANGEIFNQNDVTAAHRTLPMPSIVRVTNLENGRSLIVRVNDRGPYVAGRIIDLSRRSAQLLGIEGKGTAKVRVQIMAAESRALAAGLKVDGAPEAAAAPREAVAAETLPAPGSREAPHPIARPAAPPPPAVAKLEPENLAKQQVKVVPVKATQIYVQAGAFSRFDNANRLKAKLATIGHANITQTRTASGTFFRVRLGPLANVGDADALLEKVIKTGYPDARIVVD